MPLLISIGSWPSTPSPPSLPRAEPAQLLQPESELLAPPAPAACVAPAASRADYICSRRLYSSALEVEVANILVAMRSQKLQWQMHFLLPDSLAPAPSLLPASGNTRSFVLRL